MTDSTYVGISDNESKVLDVFQADSGPLSLVEIATRAGLGVPHVRLALRGLVDRGQLKCEELVQWRKYAPQRELSESERKILNFLHGIGSSSSRTIAQCVELDEQTVKQLLQELLEVKCVVTPSEGFWGEDPSRVPAPKISRVLAEMKRTVLKVLKMARTPVTRELIGNRTGMKAAVLDLVLHELESDGLASRSEWPRSNCWAPA